MKKFRFSKDFKNLLADKLMDLGNFAAGGLVIAQFISDKTFSAQQLIVGIILSFACYFASFIIKS